MATLDGPRASHVAAASVDEFARALRGASLARSELEEAGSHGDRGLQAGTLSGLLRVGAVVAGRGLQLEHVSARACELCGCADAAAFRKVWKVLGPVLRRSLDESSSARHQGRPLLIFAGSLALLLGAGSAGRGVRAAIADGGGRPAGGGPPPSPGLEGYVEACTNA